MNARLGAVTRCSVWLALGFIVGPGGSLVAQDSTVTLDEAIRLARLARPTVAQARASLRSAEAQVRSSTGAYLPNVNATSSGNTSYSETPLSVNQNTGAVSTSRSTRNVSFGVNASIDLFTGFRRGADRRAAKAGASAADASLTDAEYQAELLATQQFFDALAAQQVVRVRQASVRRAQEQLTLSIAKLKVGSATRSDSLRSLVNLGNARLTEVTAESDVAGAQAGLGRTLGLDHGVAAADDSSYYSFSLGLDTVTLMQEALDHAPSVMAAEANARAARASVSSARAAYWPTLALSGSNSWNGSDANDYQLFANRSLTLGLTWPLFNRFQREQNIATRLGNLDAAEATAADARRNIRASLVTQIAALEAARLRIEITQTSVTAAAEDLRVVSERYRVGAATILDVLTSQEALAQAEVDAITSRFDFLKARAQIEALIGHRL
jgi:outer membrane protein TolC